MPLPLPRQRPDRPRLRIEPGSARERELPVRTYAFDPDAARQAWRQVARTRGANGMRLDGRDAGSRLAPLALGLVAVVAAVLWWSGGEEPEAVEAPQVAAAGLADVAEAVMPSTDPEESGLDPLPQAAISPNSYGAYDEPPPELSPRDAPIRRRARILPPGTSDENARALAKLPHSPHDRSPVGGIGRHGLHIDRITMGTAYDDGSCSGPVGKFSIESDRRVNVCFRAVHRRMDQRVIVRWEKDGELVRRTFVSIGDGHAYRTRAVLPLRKSYRGTWTARIFSTDGVELASQTFEVLR